MQERAETDKPHQTTARLSLLSSTQGIPLEQCSLYISRCPRLTLLRGRAPCCFLSSRAAQAEPPRPRWRLTQRAPSVHAASIPLPQRHSTRRPPPCALPLPRARSSCRLPRRSSHLERVERVISLHDPMAHGMLASSLPSRPSPSLTAPRRAHPPHAAPHRCGAGVPLQRRCAAAAQVCTHRYAARPMLPAPPHS